MARYQIDPMEIDKFRISPPPRPQYGNPDEIQGGDDSRKSSLPDDLSITPRLPRQDISPSQPDHLFPLFLITFYVIFIVWLFGYVIIWDRPFIY